MPRIVTILILIAVLVASFATTSWATGAYMEGTLTPGNWLTIIGLLLTFTGMIVAGVYWLSTNAGRLKAVAELLVRLEKTVDKHTEDDKLMFADIKRELRALREQRHE